MGSWCSQEPYFFVFMKKLIMPLIPLPRPEERKKIEYPGLDKGGRGGFSGLVSAFAAPPSGGFF
jgi:hypothetical protein